MAIVTIKFKEAREFARDNGYLYAYYEKQEDGNWHLITEEADYDTDISDDTEVLVMNVRGNLNMKEVVTPDKTKLFRLHNNFNLPRIIPCFK